MVRRWTELQQGPRNIIFFNIFKNFTWLISSFWSGGILSSTCFETFSIKLIWSRADSSFEMSPASWPIRSDHITFDVSDWSFILSLTRKLLLVVSSSYSSYSTFFAVVSWMLIGWRVVVVVESGVFIGWVVVVIFFVVLIGSFKNLRSINFTDESELIISWLFLGA